MPTSPKKDGTWRAHAEYEKHMVPSIYLSYVIKAGIQRNNAPLKETQQCKQITSDY